MKTAVYPGSFDPLTYGHTHIIQRALPCCDKLILAIIDNPQKKSFFSHTQKLDLYKAYFSKEKKIEILTFSGLLVDFMQKIDASIVIRGLRNTVDFEYEKQMAVMNKKLYPQLETIFFMADPEYDIISSTLIKEILNLHGDISPFVPTEINIALKENLDHKQ